MKLRTRRIIMFSFILAFFILAPILLFYASGYRLDFKRYKILRTGTLFIEGKDVKKANLYINDKLIDQPFIEKTFVYNLLPGDYNVKLSKEGYHDWEKKITVSSSLTTFVQDAVLFKKEIPLQIVDGQIDDFSISPDWQKIIYINRAEPFVEFYLYDLANNDKLLLYRVTSSTQNYSFSWAPSSKKVLVNYDGTFVVLDTQNPKNNLGLKNIMDFKPANIYWDLESDNLAYTQSKNAVYKIDLFNKTAVKIFQTQGDLNPEFFKEGNDIFYIRQEAAKNILYKYNLRFETDKAITDLNKSAHYKFIKSTNNYLGLIDLDAEKLILIKKVNAELEINIISEEPIKEFQAKDALWDPAEKVLLMYNDFEISTFNPSDGKQNFINRYGQVIKKIDWYPDLEHIIILFENNLQIIDLTQDVGTRNYIEIVKFDSLNNFYLDKKGEIAYFNGKIGKQQGLYKLFIK
jgi:hypothetical protein